MIFLRLLSLCIVSQKVSAFAGDGALSGKNKQKSRLLETTLSPMRHDEEPDQDNVISPPVLPYSDAPTTFPSNVPSVKPSTSPSLELSDSPSTRPTLEISDLPSTRPTNLPTMTPSQSPSSEPSLNPSLHPTVSPECMPNVDGIYGSKGESQFVVIFGYELETKFGDVQNEIIPSLETSFSEAILPELFSGKCSTRFRRRLRRLAAVGVSSQPEDTILDNILCEKKNSEENACNVVQGELTIFTDGESQDFGDRSIQIIKDKMTNNSFLDVHEGIERVSYVQLESQSSNIGGEGNPELQSERSDQPGVLYGVIAGIVVGVISLVLLLWAVKKRAKEDDDDDSSARDQNASLTMEAGKTLSLAQNEVRDEDTTTCNVEDTSEENKSAENEEGSLIEDDFKEVATEEYSGKVEDEIKDKGAMSETKDDDGDTISNRSNDTRKISVEEENAFNQGTVHFN